MFYEMVSDHRSLLANGKQLVLCDKTVFGEERDSAGDVKSANIPETEALRLRLQHLHSHSHCTFIKTPRANLQDHSLVLKQSGEKMHI